MQRKPNIKLLVLMSVGVLTLCGLVGVRRYLRSLPPRGEPEIREVNGIDPSMICLVSSETDYFIATSTLVVRGTFTGETDGPKFLNLYRPFSCEGFHVTEVYKGDCKAGDDIAFAHMGGEVSFYQMLKDAEERGIEKRAHLRMAGFSEDIKSYDLEHDTIYRLTPSAKARHALPHSGEEYVLFLSWDPNWECYAMGLTEEYHIRKVNSDGQVLNPFTEEYETIDWERAAKLTREDVLPGFVSYYEAHPEWFED